MLSNPDLFEPGDSGIKILVLSVEDIVLLKNFVADQCDQCTGLCATTLINGSLPTFLYPELVKRLPSANHLIY